MKKKILIVVDMQKDFVDGALGTLEAQAILPSVAQKIKTHEGDIIATFDTHESNYLLTSEGKALPVEHCIKGTDGWRLHSEVSKALEGREYVSIEKPTFGSTELISYISENYDPSEIEIELIGLCTDICVVSNALLLKANFYETQISVDAKATAGVTEKSHLAALETMKMCQINILN